MPRLPDARSPFRHLALFLAVTVVPSVLLAVFGWQLLDQDRSSALAGIEARQNDAATFAEQELRRRLSDVSATLADDQARLRLVESPGAVTVAVDEGVVRVQPADRVAWVPGPPELGEPDWSRHREGESLEIAGDLPAAAAWYESLAQASDPALRAGALIRHARVLRKMKRPDDALRVLERAASIDDVAVEGAPVALVAQWARCNLLDAVGRTDALRSDAGRLLADLEGGRWALARSVYEANAHDGRMWAGNPPTSAAGIERERLAMAIDVLHVRATEPGRPSSIVESGHEQVEVSGTTLTIVWRRESGRLQALVATSAYVEREWIDAIRPALRLQRAELRIGEAPADDASTDETVRVAAVTGLPWDLRLVSTGLDEELRAYDTRRQLWLAGLLALVVLLLAGTAVSIRTVARELATARLQSDFVATVSHEFRTPLTAMRQVTEVLTDKRVADESRRQAYYRALTRQTDRLQRLVESLLDFGRMEAGRAPYHVTTGDVLTFARQVAAAFAGERAAGGAAVAVRVTGVPCLAKFDADALGHALWNLFDNAVKYGPAAGPVDVDVSVARDEVTIGVRDRGVGISRDEQRRVFDKFVRGAHANTEGIRGTGLGLAIVAHVVAAHGGRVTVTSAPDEGSTFTIRLPLAEPLVEVDPAVEMERI